MYKQVTPDQLEVWLADPVTAAYLDSMQYCFEKTQETISNGSNADPRNADATQYNAGFYKGCRDTLSATLNPEAFLGAYERPEVANVNG